MISGFQGEFRFLSNFYPCPVNFEGFLYKSSEAAYQSSKTNNSELKSKFMSLNAREARQLGQVLEVRSDWEDIKLNVMYRILRAKFSQNITLKTYLLNTKSEYLEETNYWHDTFWGVYNGIGQNHLGKLLMLVRDELKEGII